MSVDLLEKLPCIDSIVWLYVNNQDIELTTDPRHEISNNLIFWQV